MDGWKSDKEIIKDLVNFVNKILTTKQIWDMRDISDNIDFILPSAPEVDSNSIFKNGCFFGHRIGPHSAILFTKVIELELRIKFLETAYGVVTYKVDPENPKL